MTEENDQAYPFLGKEWIDGEASNENYFGLTKREHFAGIAMQAYASGKYTVQNGMPNEQIAEWSVKMADALIKALNNNTEDK